MSVRLSLARASLALVVTSASVTVCPKSPSATARVAVPTPVIWTAVMKSATSSSAIAPVRRPLR